MKYIYGEIVEDNENKGVGLIFRYNMVTISFWFNRLPNETKETFFNRALEIIGGEGWQVTPYYNPLQKEVVYFITYPYQDNDQVNAMLDGLRNLSSSESELE